MHPRFCALALALLCSAVAAQSGASWPVAPAKTYSVSADGSEAKDSKTGLVWARCSVGQRWDGKTCAGQAQKFTFSEAQALAGQGWRLPTARELVSLIHCSSGKTDEGADPGDGAGPVRTDCDGDLSRPTIRSDVFPNTPDDSFWTASPHPEQAQAAWLVTFYDGMLGYQLRRQAFHVRLLRAR